MPKFKKSDGYKMGSPVRGTEWVMEPMKDQVTGAISETQTVKVKDQAHEATHTPDGGHKASGFKMKRGSSPIYKDLGSSPLMDHQKDTDGNIIEHDYEGVTGDIVSGSKRVKHDIGKKVSEQYESFTKDPIGTYGGWMKSAWKSGAGYRGLQYLHETFTGGKD